jgi:hypothetical protein
MKKLLLTALLLVGMTSMVFSQENYSSWSNVRNIVLNTKTTGAGSTTDLANFPVLIRLTAADSLVFTKSQKNGQDIRFSKYNGVHFPYQIEQWDSAGRTAAIWVRVDTVKAADSTQAAYLNGYLKMYTGNAAAADSSKGASVFNITNNYTGVWHLSEEAAGMGASGSGTYKDAVGLYNGDDSIANTDQGGIVGNGHGFTTGLYNTGDYIACRDTVQSFYNKAFTVSLWAKITAGATYGGAIMAKRTAGNDCGSTDFYFGNGTTNDSNDGLVPQFVSPCNNFVIQTTPVTAGVWNHIAFSHGTAGSTGKIYINGNSKTITNNTLNYTTGGDGSAYVKIGQCEGVLKLYTNASRTFNGNMDEFEISNIQRSDDWIKVSYKNQLANAGFDSLVISGALIAVPGTPILTTPANAATNVAVLPTLTWGTVAGATTYRVQVAAVSDFSTVAVDDSTLTAGTKTLTTALSGNATYYWRANAKNAAGTSAWSTAFSFTTVPAAPAAPVLATPATAATAVALAPTLTWGTVSGAVTYRVQVSTISTFATTVVDDSTLAVGTKAITGLANSTTYYWQVNAKNAGGTSAWSTFFSFTTVPATSGVPTLTAPSDGATSIALAPTLTWGTVSGAATYRVQLSTVSTFATTVVDDSTLTVGTKAITGLANSTTYYWRANAKNSGGTSAWATAYSFTTIVAAPATAPVLTTPANAATGISVTPTLTWGTVAGAATYRVQLSTVSTFASTVVDDSTLTAGTKAITSALTVGVTYYWRVNAKNAGGTSAWSTLSGFTTVTTGIIAATPHYVPATMGHNGVLEVYMANGSRVMEIAYGASATKAQLLNSASKTLAKGYYTYRFRSIDANVEIVGKLVK